MNLFDDVIGHEKVIDLLEAELASPAQAYLFTGPQSVGKEHVALRFAGAGSIRASRFQAIVEGLAALFILAIGLSLLYASLLQPTF